MPEHGRENASLYSCLVKQPIQKPTNTPAKPKPKILPCGIKLPLKQLELHEYLFEQTEGGTIF